MLDRDKVETILRRRFSGAGASQIAAATNAIMGLGEFARDGAIVMTPDDPIRTRHTAAEQRDLEQTSKAHVALTLQCVECHRYLVRARIAR